MRAVLFDLDGTLVDSSIGILDSMRFAMQELGIEPPPEEQLRHWIGPPLQQATSALLGTDDPQAIQRAVQIYRRRYREWGVRQAQLFPGVAELLEHLAQRGLPLGVATSKPTEFARQILAHQGVDRHFQTVCGADWEGRLTKADLIGQALQALQAVAAESVMVGDRVFDVLGAHQHDMATVAVTYGFGRPQELEQAGADHICHSVQELRDSLEAFFQ
jgi:phosphoglycolate phosphatase